MSRHDLTVSLRGSHRLLVAIAGCGLLAVGCAAPEKIQVMVVGKPPAEGHNDHYIGHRAPLTPAPLVKLPIGAIAPQGWLGHQLELQADGMVGHLTEISKWCSFDDSAWTKPDGEGQWPWEEMPYWLKGFGDTGYVLGDQRIIAETKKWIEAVIASQRPDGTFGAQDNLRNNDLWPHMCMLYALRSYHEATGDPRVLSLMTRYFKYVSTIPAEKLFAFDQEYRAGWWQWVRAADQLDSIHWLYNRTGDAWLLDLAKVNHERTADWTGGIPSWHGVNICECFRGPAQFYPQSRDPQHLQAAYRNYDTVIGQYGQVPGGMFGADENCREGFTGPRQGAETCSIVEIMHSHEMLTRITGDVLWADRCEEVAFNSLPAALTPGLKALHYLTAPNQIQLDRQNKAPMIQNRGDMFSYTPYEQYRCCQHNVAFGWPYFAEHLWMATLDNGLAAVLYAPSVVKAKVADGVEVRIMESGGYPFSDTVALKVGAPQPVQFPLYLRIPGWCGPKASLKVNEELVEVTVKPGTWLRLDRTWTRGDTVQLGMDHEVSVKRWDKNHRAASVHWGPLAFSLAIKEKWQEYDNGRPWSAHEVLPGSPWNYGLVLDPEAPAAGLKPQLRMAPAPDQPFTPANAPVRIAAKGKRIGEWEQESNGLVGEIPASPVRSDQPVEDITLIPMGCARLRISSFPVIGDGPDAKVWTKPPPRPALTASWRGLGTLLAVIDGILPTSSADTTIPRFTWWPHKGTREYIEIILPEPKKVSAVEVYWFDDGPEGEYRVPKSWELQHRLEDRQWEAVRTSDDYAVEKDQLNRITFEPVKASRLRLQVALQPEHSAGILEWKIIGEK